MLDKLEWIKDISLRHSSVAAILVCSVWIGGGREKKREGAECAPSYGQKHRYTIVSLLLRYNYLKVT